MTAQPTPLYTSIMWAVRKRIQLLGWTMADCDEKSGVQDGYTAKMMHPDTATGRQARWETLQTLLDALYPGGFQIKIIPLEDSAPASAGMVEKMRARKMVGRMQVRDFAAAIARFGGKARFARMTPKQLIRHQRRAANARWRRERERRKAAAMVNPSDPSNPRAAAGPQQSAGARAQPAAARHTRPSLSGTRAEGSAPATARPRMA